MENLVLDVKNLRVQFESDEKVVQAVNDISFQVKRGQTLGIVGESGSGKSVTSLAIMGLLSPDTSQVSGEILFRFSNNLNESQPDSKLINLLQLSPQEKQEYRGGQIAMIFQEPMSSLNPVYTIGFQLIEAIKQHEQVSPRQAMWKATSLLQEVKLLPSDEELLARVETELAATNTANNIQNITPEKRNEKREVMQQVNDQKRAMLDRYPHELSGGQLQRVMIAIAISCNPTLLIADEPTTALDVTVQATILDLLRELCSRRGMSMIFITHDLGVIAKIADTVAVMYRGKIVEYGTIQTLFLKPQHPYTKGLLACRPPLDIQVERLPTISDFMEVETTATGELEIREKNININDIQASSSPTPERQPSTTASLSVEHLRVGFKVSGVFGETKRLLMAVNDVSFEVYQGETLGLVGESGCGKSTLARALLQLIPVVSGKVTFEGEDITKLYSQASTFEKIKNYKKHKQYHQKRQELRREMQIIFQDPFSSVDPRMTIGDTIMEPMLIHGVSKAGKERRDRVAYLLERVEMKPDWMGRYPHEFSGGQRQRVCIARSLALNPKFIICDESVSALDVSVQAQVLNLLKELQAEFGLTYIFISHDLSVVKFISDRIMVMNRGKIEEIGQAEDIYHRPQTEYTRQLIASIPTGNIKPIAS
ncbi:nickel import ATP-binding protein NikE [Lyngbya aestuarii BL J]|uniref:Nickel import ATP-binding protein NikE n=1 Tax=Lyngbya aestuarii BL J TaxID=1348334 RepID=U7QE28_9CYAN|nr:ABC transporter ATP-binding protein [Lyngbya aestuarii]ERT06154.1 nickel import ATP-binding protein NikE [Lyngbya aestuarii BL J]